VEQTAGHAIKAKKKNQGGIADVHGLEHLEGKKQCCI